MLQNLERIQKESVSYLLNQLKQLGGWPVLEGDAWKHNNFSWTDTLYQLRQKGFGENSLLVLTVLLDLKNATRRHLVVNS